MVLMSTDSVELDIAGCVSAVPIYPTHVPSSDGAYKHLLRLRQVLVAIFLHVLEKRPPRCCSLSPPPPLTLRTAATTQRVMQGSKQTTFPRSDRIERRAARGGAGEGGGGVLEQRQRRGEGEKQIGR